MIDLYFAPTPNGLKARLFLEEAALAYRLVPLRLSKGEHQRADYLAINPNAKIPAIVDHDPGDGGPPLALFESGAILLHLAQKSGRLLPADPRDRAEALQWLFWQVSALGPMAGQIGHFAVFAPQPVPYAIERYRRETQRLYAVLDRRLAGREWIAGSFSIADIACYPWIVPHRGHGIDLDAFADLRRWFAAIAARPATRRVYDGVEDVYSKPRVLDADERRVLFGPTGVAAPTPGRASPTHDGATP
jgi:GST-like protein